MAKAIAKTGGVDILNYPNIPQKLIHALQDGRLERRAFVANLDDKAGWTKLMYLVWLVGWSEQTFWKIKMGKVVEQAL